MAVNVQSPRLDLLKDSKLRLAISLAIDRPAIVKDIFLGEGEVAQSFIDPANFTKRRIPEAYSYDPGRAKQLASEVGAIGKTVNLFYMPVSRPYDPDPKKLAEAVKVSLEKIGLNVRLATVGYDHRVALAERKPIVRFDDDPVGEVVATGNFVPDLAMYSVHIKSGDDVDLAQYGDNPLAPASKNPGKGRSRTRKPIAVDRIVNVTTAGIGTTNYARYSNPTIDDLYHQLNSQSDPTRREKIMRQIDVILEADLPVIPIGKVNVTRVIASGVRYTFDPVLQIERLHQVILSHDSSAAMENEKSQSCRQVL